MRRSLFLMRPFDDGLPGATAGRSLRTLARTSSHTLRKQLKFSVLVSLDIRTQAPILDISRNLGPPEFIKTFNAFISAPFEAVINYIESAAGIYERNSLRLWPPCQAQLQTQQDGLSVLRFAASLME